MLRAPGFDLAPELKKAGYDGIVISGRAQRPTYLWINDGKAEIKDGDWLWGKGIYAVRDMLREKHGNKVRFVTTGPAMHLHSLIRRNRYA